MPKMMAEKRTVTARVAICRMRSQRLVFRSFPCAGRRFGELGLRGMSEALGSGDPKEEDRVWGELL